MIGRTLGLPLAATIADRFGRGGRQGDLPATPARGRQMHVGFFLLSALAVPIVLVTAQSHLGAGIRYLDVVALCSLYALATAALLFVPWHRLEHRWSFIGAALPVVFVASLSALTGGGLSPYSALYAPILAIAGWYLPLGQVAALVALVVTTEVWRSTALDGSRSMAQLVIALPFDIAVAIAAWASSRWLRISLTSIRLDQVQMAAAVDAIRDLGVEPRSNILHELQRSMERVFDARATVVALSASRPDGRTLAPVVLEDNVATVIVPGATKLHALVTLEGHRPFISHELRLAAVLAEVAGRTIDAREATISNPNEADHDPMTGLLNRRSLDRDLVLALNGDTGAPDPVALVFVDLDGFKALNDRHGHAMGDAVLVRLAELLRSIARRQDRLYRFGGDEFALLLRKAGENEASSVAERLLVAIARGGGRDDDVALPDARASIGVAVSKPGWSPTELLNAADAAIHAAKRAGGGVTRVYGEAFDS